MIDIVRRTLKLTSCDKIIGNRIISAQKFHKYIYIFSIDDPCDQHVLRICVWGPISICAAFNITRRCKTEAT